MTRGRFITIEGGEGVGKSLFIKLLTEKLRKAHIPLVGTHEPGGTPVADIIRKLFKHPPTDDVLLPQTELFLVSAARVQHIQTKILPELAAGNWVLCDRYYDSTRVYQGIIPGIELDTYETIIELSAGDCSPDITFLLDCPVDVIIPRLAARNTADDGKDRFDEASREYHIKLRHAFLQVAAAFPDRIVIIDAAQPPELIIAKAVAVLAKMLGRPLE